MLNEREGIRNEKSTAEWIVAFLSIASVLFVIINPALVIWLPPEFYFIVEIANITCIYFLPRRRLELSHPITFTLLLRLAWGERKKYKTLPELEFAEGQI